MSLVTSAAASGGVFEYAASSPAIQPFVSFDGHYSGISWFDPRFRGNHGTLP